MINKNVADYTNFDGKTNKKIVQAPGGLSSISLSWNNELSSQNNLVQKQYAKNNLREHQEIYKSHNKNSNEDKTNINNQMKVMDTNENYQIYNNFQQKYQTNEYNNPIKNSAKALIGGEYGYNNYKPKNQSNQHFKNFQKQNHDYKYLQNKKKYESTQNSMENITPISIYKPSTSSSKYSKNSFAEDLQNEKFDSALQQQKSKIQGKKIASNSKNLSQFSNTKKTREKIDASSNKQGRACIKMQTPQKQNIIFGDDYNYWKQSPESNGRSSLRNPNKNSLNVNILPMESKIIAERTSVKINVPPGGKTSFTLG